MVANKTTRWETASLASIKIEVLTEPLRGQLIVLNVKVAPMGIQKFSSNRINFLQFMIINNHFMWNGGMGGSCGNY